MNRILNAVKDETPKAALEWDCADFLEQQNLAQID